MNPKHFGSAMVVAVALAAWACGAGCTASPLDALDAGQSDNVTNKIAPDGRALVSSTDKAGDTQSNPHGGPPGKQPKCNAPLTLCSSGSCVNTQTDYNNCGACSRRCTNNEVCSAGACTCSAADQTDCGGLCVYTENDEANCGACGNVCGTGTTCISGTCVPPPGGCPSGSADCDNNGSCETNTSFDNLNCGGCGIRCSMSDPSETCSAGVCELVEPCLDCGY